MKRKGIIFTFTLILATVSVMFFLLYSTIAPQDKGKLGTAIKQEIETERNCQTDINVFLELTVNDGKMRELIKNYTVSPTDHEKNMIENKMKTVFTDSKAVIRISSIEISNGISASGEPKAVAKRYIAIPQGKTQEVELLLW